MIKKNVSLKTYNTFGIDAKARFLFEAQSVESLQDILSDPYWQDMPKLVLGEGSNVLLTQDFPGLVLKINLRGIERIAENEDHVWVTAGAGENWHQLVRYCLENEYAGVENLSLIPGTVGAAPMQNIGAYGVELQQVFDHLTAIQIQDGQMQTFDKDTCLFGYRNSIFKNTLKNKYIIAAVTLRLNKKPIFQVEYGAIQDMLKKMNVSDYNIQAISDAIIQIRTQKLPDPKKIGNAGSFFKNPLFNETEFKAIAAQHPNIPHFKSDAGQYKIPAAWLIEQCHWKGRRFGNIGVHEQHALVLVNYGGGSGESLKQLAEDIQASVFDKFAVQLLPEVNII